jgi:peptidoglycan hydrolase-like protein with peptidoglycan-binding domain
MALGLIAPGAFGVSPKSTTKKPAARSARHSSSHSHSRPQHARRKLPAAPTPERYQEIQQALAARGYYKGTANGTWNSDSVDALKRFQADQNLPPDGKLTSLSLIAMGLGPKRSRGAVPATGPATGPAAPASNSPSAPPPTSAAPVTMQPNPTPAPPAPAGAH